MRMLAAAALIALFSGHAFAISAVEQRDDAALESRARAIFGEGGYLRPWRVWRSVIARLIRLRHQNHTPNQPFRLYPPTSNATLMNNLG